MNVYISVKTPMTTPKKADHLQPPPLIDDQAIEIHIITNVFTLQVLPYSKKSIWDQQMISKLIVSCRMSN